MAHHAEALRAEGADEELVAALCRDPERAPLTARGRAVADYAIALTRLQPPPSPTSLQPLRDAGLDDREILHLVQVVGYFNYVNRHADGLGVTLEPDHPGRRWAETAVRGGRPDNRA